MQSRASVPVAANSIQSIVKQADNAAHAATKARLEYNRAAQQVDELQTLAIVRAFTKSLVAHH